jgi:negative regulator of genetic competence, sporulation and motility
MNGFLEDGWNDHTSRMASTRVVKIARDKASNSKRNKDDDDDNNNNNNNNKKKMIFQHICITFNNFMELITFLISLIVVGQRFIFG